MPKCVGIDVGETVALLVFKRPVRFQAHSERNLVGGFFADGLPINGVIHHITGHVAAFRQFCPCHPSLFQLCGKVNFGHGTRAAFSGPRLCEVGIQAIQMIRTDILQLDMSDSGIDARCKVPIP